MIGAGQYHNQGLKLVDFGVYLMETVRNLIAQTMGSRRNKGRRRVTVFAM
jgi:hypothetical protein